MIFEFVNNDETIKIIEVDDKLVTTSYIDLEYEENDEDKTEIEEED